MTTATSEVHSVFRALGDPTRQRIIEWMAAGETPTATEVAAKLPMTRQGVSRHLDVLVEHGLVRGSRSGREVRYTLQVEPLGDAERWLSHRTASWERALQRLASHLDEGETS